MSELHDQVQALIDSLTTNLQHVDALESAEANHDGLTAQLEATQKQLADVQAQLADESSQLDAAKIAAAQQHEKDIYDAQQTLKSLNDQMSAAKSDLDAIQAQVIQSRTEHDQILASMDSLRKRLG